MESPVRLLECGDGAGRRSPREPPAVLPVQLLGAWQRTGLQRAARAAARQVKSARYAVTDAAEIGAASSEIVASTEHAARRLDRCCDAAPVRNPASHARCQFVR